MIVLFGSPLIWRTAFSKFTGDSAFDTDSADFAVSIENVIHK